MAGSTDIGDEDKEDFKTRMHAEGRWDRFKDAREDLVRDGMDRSLAWKVAGKLFPPLEPGDPDWKGGPRNTPVAVRPEPKKPPPPKDEPAAKPDKKVTLTAAEEFVSTNSRDARRTIMWVFDHWKLEDVTERDAPSSGAWFLVEQMRHSQAFVNEFYRSIWPKLLPTRTQLDELAAKNKDDGRATCDLIDNVEAMLNAE